MATLFLYLIWAASVEMPATPIPMLPREMPAKAPGFVTIPRREVPTVISPRP